MVALPRKTQKIFGVNAGTNQRGVIGSFAAGSPAYSNDPDVIQSLANYETGWYGVVVAQNSPAIQDMNSLDFLITRQLAYIFERGIPEYDAATTYYIGSWVLDSTGSPYKSIANNNLGNPLSDSTKWTPALGSLTTISISDSPYSPKNGDVVLVQTSTGAISIQLPNPALSAGFKFTFVDSQGSANVNAITLLRFGSEKIENLTSNYVMEAAFGRLTLICDGTDFFFI